MSLFSFLGKSRRSVGLDIADRTIEVVELKKRRGGIVVANSNRVLLEPGVLERGRVVDSKKLAEAVRAVFSNALPQPIDASSVHFALPDSQVYVHVVKVAAPDGESVKAYNAELEREVREAARRVIPLPVHEMVYDYRVLVRDNGVADVLLVVASKEVCGEWETVFRGLDMHIDGFDVEPLAIYRGLLGNPVDAPVGIVDIGATLTGISLFGKQGLRVAHTVRGAGERLTQAIAKELEVSSDEAEKLKRNAGLIEGENTAEVLKKALSDLILELERVLKLFEQKTKQHVSEIVVVGGSGNLPGLVEYLQSQLGVRVAHGSVSKDIQGGEALLGKSMLEYVEVVGLALKGLDPRWHERDPQLPFMLEAASKSSAPASTGRVAGGSGSVGLAPARFLMFLRRKLLWATAPRQSRYNQERGARTAREARNEKKIRKQILAFVVILMVGAVLVSGAFWFRSSSRQARQEQLQAQSQQFSFVRSFDVSVSLVVNPALYSNNAVRGRIIQDVVDLAGDYNEALVTSRINVEKQLQEGETLWTHPISAAQADFPMSFTWLAYSEEDANRLFAQKAKDAVAGRVEFALNNIEKTDVTKASAEHEYLLHGTVSISINEEVDIPSPVGEMTGDGGN